MTDYTDQGMERATTLCQRLGIAEYLRPQLATILSSWARMDGFDGCLEGTIQGRREGRRAGLETAAKLFEDEAKQCEWRAGIHRRHNELATESRWLNAADACRSDAARIRALIDRPQPADGDSKKEIGDAI